MEEQRAPGIVLIATKYGLIQGVGAFVVFVVTTLAGIKQGWVGTAVDVAVLILLMVLAHREFRKTHRDTMTYPQGLGSGTLLSSVASVVSCVLVYVDVKYINTGYLAAAMETQRTALAQQGISGAQAQQAMAILANVLTPTGVAVTSLIVGVIVGFIVALIVSIFTQNDPRRV
jgi:hypothetical protein